MRGNTHEWEETTKPWLCEPARLLEPLEPRWLLSVALPGLASSALAATVSTGTTSKTAATSASQAADTVIPLATQSIGVASTTATQPTLLASAVTGKPSLLTWPVDWSGVYGSDNGGPTSTAKANQILSRFKSMGIQYVSISSNATVEKWLAPLVSAKGLLKVLVWGWSTIFNATPGTANTTNVNGTYVYNEALHTNYQNTATSWHDAVCPNYRGSLYTKYFSAFTSAVQMAKPDFVVVDSEIFSVPSTVDAASKTITDCTTCKTVAGYMQGLQQWVNKHISIVHATNASASTIFFRGWNTASRTAAQIFQAGGANSPSGNYPSPGMYSSQQYDDLDAFKKIVGTLGYTWLYPTNPATGDMAMSKFQSIVNGLKTRGALGTALFADGWYATGSSDAYNEKIWSYVQAAQSIFAGVPVPATPTGLTAKTMSTSQVDLTWNDMASNETGFRIQHSLDGTNWTEVGTISQSNATGYSVTGLASNAWHYFRVSAYNASGDSPFSSVASAAILTGDANGDAKVDFNDYLVLESNYGQPGGLAQGDFNGDGTVNFNDYLVLEANYGKTI